VATARYRKGEFIRDDDPGHDDLPWVRTDPEMPPFDDSEVQEVWRWLEDGAEGEWPDLLSSPEPPCPYREERAEHGDLPGVYVVNCPMCWPKVSCVWLDDDDNVLGQPCGCGPEKVKRALGLPEPERCKMARAAYLLEDQRQAERMLKSPLHKLREQAEASAYQRGLREGLSIGRHGVSVPPEPPRALQEMGRRAQETRVTSWKDLEKKWLD
jgi:hypothetical protein